MVELAYRVVDVFAEAALTGNPLAVFPEAPDLPDDLMQRVAREMNLSETAFVTSKRPDGYSSRIFTPATELPFAGHPTLGTAWVLRSDGAIRGDEIIQSTEAGDTRVSFEEEEVWFDRGGDGGADLPDIEVLAEQLGVSPKPLGAEWEAASGPVRLLPAVADCGIPQLMVPVESVQLLTGLRSSDVRELEGTDGAYFFARTGDFDVSARFFAGGLGLPEDAATGSAAAGLGLYLGQRIGAGRISISQGSLIGRPSKLELQFAPGQVRVGGRVVPVARGVLTI